MQSDNSAYLESFSFLVAELAARKREEENYARYVYTK